MSDTAMPEAIRAFVDTTNAGDSEGFVAAFTEDAYVNDWGREFHGREGVASWNESDNIGRNAHVEAHAIRTGRLPGQYLLTVTVSGGGYNGPGVFTFDLRDGLIARFLIA
ncbi:nuclear transport factor 2 family protein [Agromyces binzhouensis]|uniref:Nuclear transport factor 2 family protein n=1 Tax=Agromyces binzhouensis TaxID=1817495 RepID=A0A4Q2JEH5_9MICO|nr:nuclear transport factor 2 family protein [Agromyces binzhouensis]RXZ45932.1 nuclear transport factor 2 family protein [Agromyces binzhouensis]